MIPDISIIIPFRDQITLLQQCLDSLVKILDDNKIEVILLNNRSKQEEVARLILPKEIPTQLIDANIDFHFQKLINLGARHAKGRFLLLLNSDIIFTDDSKGCFKSMCDLAAQEEVGAVGPLLLYPDGTIQHAGVVVGMNGYADHLYRGWSFQQAENFPFHSPKENRFVSAVTAACLMVEKKKFEQINGMDERFIVCGGDVDLCIRLHQAGYRNVYVGEVSLVHLESKTRDPYAIPKVDFTESERSYGDFLKQHEGRDPYYPEPLPLKHVPYSWKRKLLSFAQEKIKSIKKLGSKIKRHFTSSYHEPFEKVLVDLWIKCRQRVFSSKRSFLRNISVDSLKDKHVRRLPTVSTYPLTAEPRLNILVPSLLRKDIFGGIATACLIGFAFQMRHPETKLRFLLTDRGGDPAALRDVMHKYFGDRAQNVSFEIQDVTSGDCRPVSIHQQDYFFTTAWWTCHQIEHLCQKRPFFYLIQDFEPGFHAWGDDYAAALSTYHLHHVPIFNSLLLRDFFLDQRLTTKEKSLCFEPLFSFNPVKRKRDKEKNVLFFYGRQSVSRNLFKTGVCAITEALKQGAFQEGEWEFLSAGEDHPDVVLSPNAVLKSVGKLTLEGYWELLSRVDVGLSLMLSPHPSYPPLEIASSGAICVTNTFANKDLSNYSTNIISCKPSIFAIADGLKQACEKLRGEIQQEPVTLRNEIQTVLKPIVEGVYGIMRNNH